MRLHFSLLLSVVALSVVTASVRADDKKDKVVTKEGQAAGTNANAMEQAKQDALRKAVEEACGTFVSSMSKTKDYAAIYDKVFSYAQGYVKEFDIKSRRVEDGISYCTVQATVSLASFEQEWARLAHTIEAEGNPRCVVVVVEDNDVDDTVPPKTTGVAQSVIENFFLSKGVQLMDKGASDDVRSRDMALAAINDDVNKMAAMGAAFKADVVVRGVAEARKAGSTELGGKTLFKWNATISIRAYHTDSAQMLMSNSYSTSKSTVNVNQGGDDALRKCAEENAAKMLRDIGEAWRKRQNVRRICQVVIENCSRKDYKTFEDAISKETGVQAVKLRELVNNTCQVEVDWAYDLERLVGRIEELKVEGASYDVVEQTRDRVVIKIVK